MTWAVKAPAQGPDSKADRQVQQRSTAARTKGTGDRGRGTGDGRQGTGDNQALGAISNFFTRMNATFPAAAGSGGIDAGPAARNHRAAARVQLHAAARDRRQSVKQFGGLPASAGIAAVAQAVRFNANPQLRGVTSVDTVTSV